MFGAHDIISDLPSSIVQENLTMVLELVYSDNERRVAKSTSKHIWDIIYKEIVAPNIMQTEGGDEDTTEGGNSIDDDETELEEEEEEDAPSLEEDFVNETSLARKNAENVEREWQDEVIGDTSAVGSKD